MNSKITFLLYLTLNIFLVLTVMLRVPKVHFESSIFSLLPKTELQQEEEQRFTLEESFFKNLSSDVLILVRVNTDNAKQAKENEEPHFQNLIEGLQKSGYVKSLLSGIDDKKRQEIFDFVIRYKNALLNFRAREELTKDSYVKKAVSRIYSGFSGVSSDELNSDPLFLTRLVLESLSYAHFSEENGYLTVKDRDGATYRVIHLVLNDEYDNIEFSRNFVRTFHSLVQTYETACNSVNLQNDKNHSLFDALNEKPKVYPDILYLGAVFYSDYSAQTSRQEITILGSITLLAVILLIYSVFSSLKPALFALLSVMEGVLTGFVALLLLYDSISIITLGLSLSVVGIVCDYTIYYCTLYKYRDKNKSAADVLTKLFKPLLFAALTDILAYFIILYSDLMMLRQFAIFAMCTITGALLFVLAMEPLLLKEQDFKNLHEKSLPFLHRFLNKLRLLWINPLSNHIFSKKGAIGIFIFCVLLSLYGFLNHRISDDPYTFMTMPESLKTQEDKIKHLLGQDGELNYLYLETDSQDNLQTLLGTVKNRLDTLQHEKALQSYEALLLYDITTQNNDYELIKSRFLNLKDWLFKINFNLKNDNPYTNTHLHLEEYLKAPSFMTRSHLYAENRDTKRYGTLILLYDIKDKTSLIKNFSDIKEIKFVNRHERLCEIFKKLRVECSYILLGFLIALTFVLTLRLKLRLSLLYALLLALSLTTTVGILTLFGFSISIFMVLGLVLVLGIGINYMVFYTFNHKSRSSAIKALLTAFLTTLMTVGVLFFSSVSAISVFALGLITGLLLSFVLTLYVPLLVPSLMPKSV